MKMYTTPEQTANLIELGFEKPKNERWVLDVANESTPSIQNLVKRQDYSIGELLSFLPLSFNNDDYYARTIRASKVMYCDPYLDWIEIEWIKHEELIDNLFDACVELKEEGVL